VLIAGRVAKFLAGGTRPERCALGDFHGAVIGLWKPWWWGYTLILGAMPKACEGGKAVKLFRGNGIEPLV